MFGCKLPPFWIRCWQLEALDVDALAPFVDDHTDEKAAGMQHLALLSASNSKEKAYGHQCPSFGHFHSLLFLAGFLPKFDSDSLTSSCGLVALGSPGEGSLVKLSAEKEAIFLAQPGGVDL